MSRYIPAILGVLVIVGLTIPQIRMSDRFAGSNISAEKGSELLKQVPMEIGDWKGEDQPVTDEVRETAGAIGAVSRSYRNVRTGDEVKLWLVVGHARDISAHTPDVCYPGSGFTAKAAENSLHPFIYPGQKADAPFWTNTFVKEDRLTGRQLVRVFWAWYNPKPNEKVTWEAPANARWTFGNTRALYKMYFTSVMRDPSETTEQSSCVRFAREFMPVVEKVLSKIQAGDTPEAEVAKTTEAETKEDTSTKTDQAGTTPDASSSIPETDAGKPDGTVPAAATDAPATEPAKTE